MQKVGRLKSEITCEIICFQKEDVVFVFLFWQSSVVVVVRCFVLVFILVFVPTVLGSEKNRLSWSR